MPHALPPRLLRTLLLLLLTGAAAFVLASAVRYGLVERDDLGTACELPNPAVLCRVRMVFIRGFVDGVYGHASVALAALAAWRRSTVLACCGLVAGVCGMVLYDFPWSGVGVVACALALARQQGQWPEHGEAEQQAR